MTVTVSTTRLNRIIRGVDDDVADVIATIAFAVERAAKERAPVDTGALRASIYTKLKRGGHEPTQWDGVVYVAIPDPDSDLEAIVGPTVEYAIVQELGGNTHAAHPYLLPAVEQVANQLEQFNGDFRRAVTGG